MVQRRDPTSGLHRCLDRSDAVTEERRSLIDVGDHVRDTPERGRTITRRVRRTDDFDDDLAQPEEDLADRSSAEFAVPFPAGAQADGGQRLDGPTQVRREQHDVVDRDDAPARVNASAGSATSISSTLTVTDAAFRPSALALGR